MEARSESAEASDLIVLLVTGASLLVLLLVAYLTIPLHGVYTDEVYFAVPGMRMALGLDYPVHEAFNAFPKSIAPPRVGEYVYSTPLSYIYAGVFSLFEVSTYTIRMFTLGLQLAFLLFCALVATALFKRRVALLSVALLASNPSILSFSRSSPDTMFQAVLFFAAIWLIVRGIRNEDLLSWSGAAFLLGLGVNTKISLLGPALSVVGAGLFFRKSLKSPDSNASLDVLPTLKIVVYCSFFFLLGVMASFGELQNNGALKRSLTY